MPERDALTAGLRDGGEANNTDDEPDEPDERDTDQLLPRRFPIVEMDQDRHDFYTTNHDSSSTWRNALGTRLPSKHQVFTRSLLKSSGRSSRSRRVTSISNNKSSTLLTGLKSSRGKGFVHTIRSIVFLSKLNVLLVFVPLGFCSSSLGFNAIVSFVLNALAIIPLTRLLTFATENVAQTVGVAMGALLNISLGNLVEMLILIFMLRDGHIRIMIASLLGSIFVNLLLILGVAVLAGGIRYQEQKYNVKTTQTLMYLMSTGVLCLLVPTSVHACINKSRLADSVTLKLSRGMSVTLLGLYVLFLCFQLGTKGRGYDEVKQYIVDEEARYEADNPTLVNTPVQENAANMIPMHPIGSPNIQMKDSGSIESDDGSIDEPEIIIRASIALLLVSASLASISAEFLVSSIEPVLANAPLTETFLGLIILPILGNAAEMSTAVTVALKNKMDLAINVAIGSGIQISLFMAPIMVLLGWITSKNVALDFDAFQTVALLITVVMVNLLFIGGRSNYLPGALLCACYVIIGTGAYYFPNGIGRSQH